MIHKRFYSIVLPGLLLVLSVHAELDLDQLMEKGNLHASIYSRSESVLAEETTAVEKARAQAQSRSEYGLELRPRVTDSDVGAALRIYLPSRWDKTKLREQLALVAEEEQLRIAALEWQEVIETYRLFCDYRMLNKQLAIYDAELAILEPYLEKADLEVELNQFAVTDRAKLYSLYLDLLNDHEKVKVELLENRQQIHFLVGPSADLDTWAKIARIEMPPQMDFDTLMQQALKNRSDFRAYDLHARSLSAAEAVARSEDGFRLKYIQPDASVDYNNGESSVGLSASFVLPWGTRNPDIAVYQQQRALAESAMEWQQRLIGDRLQVLTHTAEAYYLLAGERNDRISPLLDQLNMDLKVMETGRLNELRDVMLVRERILDVSLQTTRSRCRKELLAVDIAEELGTLAP